MSGFEGATVSLIRSIKSYLRREPRARPFLVGFGIFFVLTVILLLMVVRLDEKPSYDEFVVAISSAFLEDTIFFLLIGGVAIWVSLVDPSAEHLDRRMNWLFNGRTSSRSAIDHIKSDIIKKGIFSPEVKLDCTFGQVFENDRAVQFNVTYRREYANLFSDYAFKMEPHRYSATPDRICPEGVANGQITSAFTGSGRARKQALSLPVNLYGEQVEKDSFIDIEPNGTTEFEHSFWCWFGVQEQFAVTLHYFTEKVRIELKNESGRILHIYDNFRKVEVHLTSGDTHLFYHEEQPAGLSRPFRLLKVV